MKRGISGVLIVLACLTMTAPRAEAAWPVVDLAAIGHLITQIQMWVQDAALQGQQIANQVLQLEQLVLQVQAWALALRNLDFTILPGVGGPLGDVINLFAMSQEAFFNAALIDEQFDQLFAPFNTSYLTGDTFFFGQAFDWNEAQRRAHWLAMNQQAHLHIQLQAGMAGLVEGLNHSQRAVGHLQGIQAGNQLLGVQVAQQMETNALLGTMANAASVRDMTDAASRDQALLRLCHALSDWGVTTPTTGLESLPTTLR